MKAIVILFVLCVLSAVPMGTESAQQEAGSAQEDSAAAVDPQERLEEFVPSEKISADSAISFPTDI